MSKNEAYGIDASLAYSCGGFGIVWRCLSCTGPTCVGGRRCRGTDMRMMSVPQLKIIKKTSVTSCFLICVIKSSTPNCLLPCVRIPNRLLVL